MKVEALLHTYEHCNLDHVRSLIKGHQLERIELFSGHEEEICLRKFSFDKISSRMIGIFLFCNMIDKWFFCLMYDYVDFPQEFLICIFSYISKVCFICFVLNFFACGLKYQIEFVSLIVFCYRKRKEKAAAAASASICLEPLQLVSSNSPQDHQDSTNMNSVHFQPLVIALPSPPLPSPEVPSFSPAVKTANPHNLHSSPEICELSVEDSERVPLKQTQLEMQPLTEIETLKTETQPTEPQVEEQEPELTEELVDNEEPQASESLHSAESDSRWQLQDLGKESEKCEQTKE